MTDSKSESNNQEYERHYSISTALTRGETAGEENPYANAISQFNTAAGHLKLRRGVMDVLR